MFRQPLAAARILVLCLMTTTATPGTGTGVVTGYVPFNNGTTKIFLFRAENISLDSPSCNSTQRFAISNADAKYQETVAALLLLSNVARADWTGEGVVNTTYSHGGTYFIYTTIADSPCGVAGRFYWSATSPDAKDMYAMALTAFTTGKKIAVHHYPSAPSCLYTAQVVNLMYITN